MHLYVSKWVLDFFSRPKFRVVSYLCLAKIKTLFLMLYRNTLSFKMNYFSYVYIMRCGHAYASPQLVIPVFHSPSSCP